MTTQTQLMTFSEWYDACLDISDEFMKCNKECEFSCREKCEEEIVKKFSEKYGTDREAILFCAYVYMSDLLDWL
jgi:hypothetical protein